MSKSLYSMLKKVNQQCEVKKEKNEIINSKVEDLSMKMKILEFKEDENSKFKYTIKIENRPIEDINSICTILSSKSDHIINKSTQEIATKFKENFTKNIKATNFSKPSSTLFYQIKEKYKVN